jgi:hypothetical protein
VHDDEKILWCVGYAVGVEAIATKDSKKLKVEVKSDCFSPAINASLITL